MSYDIKLKNKAVLMRKSGSSLNEISSELKIAKSTTSLWLANTKLSHTAHERLKKKQILGRQNAIFSKKKLKRDRDKEIKKNAEEMIKKIKFSKETAKLC